jgi:hypothetical protein
MEVPLARNAKTAADEKYDSILGDISDVIDEARRSATRSVNSIMTAAYWLIGRQVVESEQEGAERAAYGQELMAKLSQDLTSRYGRGFRKSNLFLMRAFYLEYAKIFQTPSGKSAKPSCKSNLADLARAFPLSWSHYVLLLRRGRSNEARQFYETEALQGGWSVRQLDRQINSQFYERTALSRDKAAMLRTSKETSNRDAAAPEDEIKDPYFLEFLTSRMSIPKRIWKRPSSGTWKSFFWSSAATSVSSAGRNAFESATNGTGWI